jgi:hypothetical protein
MNLGAYECNLAVSPRTGNMWTDGLMRPFGSETLLEFATVKTRHSEECKISPSFFDCWINQALCVYNPPTPSLNAPTAEIKKVEIDSFTHHVNHMPT